MDMMKSDSEVENGAAATAEKVGKVKVNVPYLHKLSNHRWVEEKVPLLLRTLAKHQCNQFPMKPRLLLIWQMSL